MEVNNKKDVGEKGKEVLACEAMRKGRGSIEVVEGSLPNWAKKPKKNITCSTLEGGREETNKK